MRIKVREAEIPPTERDIFERYGVQVIGFVLAGGFTPAAKDLQSLYREDNIKTHARDWLTERADLQERHETLTFWLEVGVLFFVILGVIIDACLLHRGL
jgi:hypothetical protein